MDLLCPHSGKIVVESFREKFIEAEAFANGNMGDRKQYSAINFLGGFIEGIS